MHDEPAFDARRVHVIRHVASAHARVADGRRTPRIDASYAPAHSFAVAGPRPLRSSRAAAPQRTSGCNMQLQPQKLSLTACGPPLQHVRCRAVWLRRPCLSVALPHSPLVQRHRAPTKTSTTARSESFHAWASALATHNNPPVGHCHAAAVPARPRPAFDARRVRVTRHVASAHHRSPRSRDARD